MIIRDYISQKLSSFSLRLREADFVDMALSYGLVLNSEITIENKDTVEKAIVKHIPTILAMPDVSEGMSISYDRAALKEFYEMRCKQLGMPNQLTKKPKITFL